MKASTKPDGDDLEALVKLAKQGGREALESVVRAIQRDVYRLALRFLWHPQDAEDATQEILVRVITGLGGFRGESQFRTWVYRVACNALLSLKKQRMEGQGLTFEAFAEDLMNGLSDASSKPSPEDSVLLEEVKIGCTLALLLCLDRDHRMAYILGEIMELDHEEASQVLEVSPAAFRKRLSRARSAVAGFLNAHCGLVEPRNACRCKRRVATAVRLGRVQPGRLLFASSLEQARAFPKVLAEIRRLEGVRRAAALYRSHQLPEAPKDFALALRRILDEGKVGGDSALV